MFCVHLGYTVTGRNRWQRFYTLDAAVRFCEMERVRTGVILTIVERG
jgi:hypothetical protein